MAAERALETDGAAPLFRDPLARALAGNTGFENRSRFRATMGAAALADPDGPEPYLAVRTRFFDDALLAALGERPIGQVVLVAAGMDARAFRLAWPARVVLYEIDRAEVFAAKEPVIRNLGVQTACERRVVCADLTADWTGLLLAAGFDPARPCAILVEGLMVYLGASQADALLAALGRLACAGSWLGMDLPNTDWFTAPHAAAYLRALGTAGSPWRFGVDAPESWLASRGWRAQVTQPGEPAANFGRWPLPVRARSIPGVPRHFFIVGDRERPLASRGGPL